MAELIDREKFRERIRRFADRLVDWGFPKEAEAVRAVAKGIKLEKTVDAAEVVRCKDCKHYSKDGIWCDMNSKDRNEWFNWYEDDFCSYGERRTDV